MSKYDLSNEAKKLLNDEPEKAVEKFTQIWNEYPDFLNNWDAFFLIKSYRLANTGNEEIEAAIMEKFRENDQVRNIYSWLLYDRHVKPFDGSEPDRHEAGFIKLVENSAQADLRNNPDQPCAYTLAVFKIMKANKKPNFNVDKIGFWLSKLDPEKLSIQSSSFKDSRGKTVEIASDYETYLSTKAKFELKSEKYEDCLATAELALSTIAKYHYDNDIWFKRYKALSLFHLDRHDEAEEILEGILVDKGGQKWFIYKEFADMFYIDKEYEKAFPMAIDAALLGRDFEKKIDLFILMAKIFEKLGRREEAILHAKLVISIVKNEEWKLKDKHLAMAKFFGFDHNDEFNFKQLLRDCQKIWEDEKWSKYPVEEGRVTAIHGNGKSGFITSNTGYKRFFSKNEIKSKVRQLEDFSEAEVSYRLKEDEVVKEGDKPHAVQINVLKMAKKAASTDGIKAGDEFTGKVKSVIDIGVFVNLGKRDGLLHISKLGKEITKENIREHYQIGDELTVKVKRITDKGPDLMLA